MICIGAFAVCGMQLFGTLMLQYSRIDLVFGNLLLVLLGDFDYEEFNQATAGSTVGFAVSSFDSFASSWLASKI